MISGIEAIDVHGHYGSYEQDESAFLRSLMSGDVAEAAQRARIDHAGITEGEKRLILHDNAMRLLRLDTRQQMLNDKRGVNA